MASQTRTMTFPPRIELRPKRFVKTDKSGFTLLEIVIVLAITAIIIGGGIAALVSSSSERILTNSSGELELLAKKARATAILNQIPYVIEFHQGFIKLLPLSESNNSFVPDIIDTLEPVNTRPSVRDQIEIDSAVQVGIRYWNTQNIITPTEKIIPVWRFNPDGLSEPVTVIFSIGESYSQDTYHPLTASIADSELVAY